MTTPVIIGDATLYLGDCREILPTLGKVDALGGTGSARVKAGLAVDYGHSDWDDEPAHEAVALARKIAKWHVIFGGNYYDLPPTSCWLIWDKLNTGDFADCEMAWTNMPKAVRRLQYLWNGCMRRERDVIRTHPTQKPVGVMKWAIEHLPPDARTILDPFMGSGTTGVACAKLGRKFIGIEIDERYFKIACARIQKAYDQPDLFVPAPKQKPEQFDLLGVT